MSQMFDFKPGDVLESRKGGANTLRHLALELATLERDGSIQIERHIPEIGVRTGHLLIFDGTLASAFHQADASRFGIEALLEIESAASALDATVSLHEMSKEVFLAAGSVTSGEREAVLFVGPKTPATSIFFEDLEAIFFAKLAPS